MATKEQATQTWWRVLYGEIKPFGGRLQEREQRVLRESQSENWFDNERDAIEYLRSRLVGRVNTTREAAMIAADKLAVFNEKYPVED